MIKVENNINLEKLGFTDSDDKTCYCYQITKYEGIVISKVTGRVTVYNDTGRKVASDRAMEFLYDLIKEGIVKKGT